MSTPKIITRTMLHLVTPPILALPNFEEPFILYTDASDVAIGGALGQIQNGVEHVIAYWSRQLKPAERKYSTVEREALAAVSAIKDFYPYLYGHTFTLVTDHHPLPSLKNLNDFGGRLTRCSLFLQQFDFKFQYKRVLMLMHFPAGLLLLTSSVSLTI